MRGFRSPDGRVTTPQNKPNQAAGRQQKTNGNIHGPVYKPRLLERQADVSGGVPAVQIKRLFCRWSRRIIPVSPRRNSRSCSGISPKQSRRRCIHPDG